VKKVSADFWEGHTVVLPNVGRWSGGSE
jgi:hypothetical protein